MESEGFRMVQHWMPGVICGTAASGGVAFFACPRVVASVVMCRLTNSIVALDEIPWRPTMGRDAINIAVRKHDRGNRLEL